MQKRKNSFTFKPNCLIGIFKIQKRIKTSIKNHNYCKNNNVFYFNNEYIHHI